MTDSYPDILVLNINTNYYSIIKDYYIWYDYQTELYYIRGSNRGSENIANGVSNSFECKSVTHLVNLIKFIFDNRTNVAHYRLYNYTNFYDNSDVIDYSFLVDNSNSDSMMCKHTDISSSRLRKVLKMMRGVYNEY